MLHTCVDFNLFCATVCSLHDGLIESQLWRPAASIARFAGLLSVTLDMQVSCWQCGYRSERWRCLVECCSSCLLDTT